MGFPVDSHSLFLIARLSLVPYNNCGYIFTNYLAMYVLAFILAGAKLGACLVIAIITFAFSASKCVMADYCCTN